MFVLIYIYTFIFSDKESLLIILIEEQGGMSIVTLKCDNRKKKNYK